MELTTRNSKLARRVEIHSALADVFCEKLKCTNQEIIDTLISALAAEIEYMCESQVNDIISRIKKRYESKK